MSGEDSRVWIGADPGGKNNSGVAVLRPDEPPSACCVSCADEAVEAACSWLEGASPAGVGVDAPLWWSSDVAGRRCVDKWLRYTYGLSGGEVQAVNSLRGAALAQGAMFVLRIREQFPGVGKKAPEIASGVSDRMCRAFGVTTSSMRVDKVPKKKMAAGLLPKESMRGHFALRFAEERSEDGTEPVTRASQVQEAFNSPFRPFVLATTSVGQEGLDFHTYCHAVVHWNLPANPGDLEQREGRVHRYKGHAVRKNLAHNYGLSVMAQGDLDPWERIFERGKEDRDDGDSDLIPFWIYSLDGGAKIERHVPALPLSQDSERLEALRASLAVYRMVFGQARQEDLIDYLLSRFDRKEVADLAKILRVDLQPPRSVQGMR